MYKTFLIFFVFLLQICNHSAIMSQETKVSGRDFWKHLNRIDLDEYVKRHNDYVLSRKDSKPIKPRSMESFEAEADYLQLPKEIENTKRYNFVPMERIPGYSGVRWYRRNYKLPESTVSLPLTGFEADFYVDSEQWSEDLTQIGINKRIPGHIRVRLYVFNTYQEARVGILRRVATFSSMRPEHYQLYKIEKGPGDVCLVRQLKGMTSWNYKIEKGPSDVCFVPLDKGMASRNIVIAKESFKPVIDDNHMVFIRGNIAIHMLSYYKDFGCMDLACRLDAFLLEQFEKAEMGAEMEAKAEE